MFFFHKTEVHTVILMCLTSLTPNWFNSYDTKRKYARNANECFCTKLTKIGNGNICSLCHNLWTNQNLDLLSTSKSSSEPQFCERWIYSWQKMARNGRKIAIYQCYSFYSDYTSQERPLQSANNELLDNSIPTEKTWTYFHECKRKLSWWQNKVQISMIVLKYDLESKSNLYWYSKPAQFVSMAIILRVRQGFTLSLGWRLLSLLYVTSVKSIILKRQDLEIYLLISNRKGHGK